MLYSTFPPKNKRPVGRPEIPLFTDDQKDKEEDFLRRAGLLIERYYRNDDPKSKLNYVFGSNGSFSKTFVWACIFLYYVHENMMQENIQAFVKMVIEAFGAKVISERTTIGRLVFRLQTCGIHIDTEESIAERKKDTTISKRHAEYLFLIDLWKSL